MSTSKWSRVAAGLLAAVLVLSGCSPVASLTQLPDAQRPKQPVKLVYNELLEYFATGPGNHHRLLGGKIEHTCQPGKNTLYYPSDGDDHPSQAGNRKATEEFIPLLNAYYSKWAAAKPQVARARETPAGRSVTGPRRCGFNTSWQRKAGRPAASPTIGPGTGVPRKA